MAGMDAALADRLREIKSSTIAVIALGFRSEDMANPLDEFGYLIPPRAGRACARWACCGVRPSSPAARDGLQACSDHDRRRARPARRRRGRADADRHGDERTPIHVLGFRGRPSCSGSSPPQRHPQYTLGHNARLRGMLGRMAPLNGLHRQRLLRHFGKRLHTARPRAGGADRGGLPTEEQERQVTRTPKKGTHDQAGKSRKCTRKRRNPPIVLCL